LKETDFKLAVALLNGEEIKFSNLNETVEIFHLAFNFENSNKPFD